MKPLTNDAGDPLYLLRNVADKTPVPGRERTVSNRLNDTPVTDADSGVEFLPILIDDAPDYDPTYQNLVSVEAANEKAGTWEITYTLEDKSQDEILAIADGIAQEQVPNVVSAQDFTNTMVRALAAVIRGGKISDEDQAFLDVVTDQADKLAAVTANRDAIKAKVVAGQKPDVEAGYDIAVAVGPVGIVPKGGAITP